MNYGDTAGSNFVAVYINGGGNIVGQGGGSYSGSFVSSSSMIINQWLHIVSVFTSTSYTSCIHYVNGVAQANSSGTNFTAFPNNPASFYITVANGGDSGRRSEYINGKYAFSRIYNTPLTAVQVQQNYLSAKNSLPGNPYGLP